MYSSGCTQFHVNRFNSMESFDMVYWYWYRIRWSVVSAAVALDNHEYVVCFSIDLRDTKNFCNAILVLLRLIGLFVEKFADRYNKSMMRHYFCWNLICALERCSVWFSIFKSNFTSNSKLISNFPIKITLENGFSHLDESS